MKQPEQTRESSLKYMTRALACMTDGQGELPFFFVKLVLLVVGKGYGGASKDGTDLLVGMCGGGAFLQDSQPRAWRDG